MDTAKPPVQCGDILAGKYRVESLLGKGGMGFVVAARHVQLEQRVAIKFMRPEALDAEGARQRFERESRAAVRLRSEHVARVLDVGMLEDNSPYIVMEYLEGSNLRTLLKQRTRLGCDEAATYIMQACEAVAEAHALGMVHRDIKPTNLFLTYTPTGRPCVKVLDFGIVKTLEDAKDGTDDATLTHTQAALGSPRYMAPEQVASAKKVDRRSDVWALGACLYQFVTGKPAFQAENLLELGAKIVHEDPVDPKELRPDLPPALAQIIMCCLDKSPERRFPDARQLGMALEQYLSPAPSVPASGAPTSSPVPVAIPVPRSGAITDRISPIDPFVPPSAPRVPTPSRAEDTGPSQNGSQSQPGRTGVTWEGSSAPTGEFRRPAPPATKMPIAIAILTLFAFVGAGLGGLALWARHSRAQATTSAAGAPPPAATSAIPEETASPVPTPTPTPAPTPTPTETTAAPEPIPSAAPTETVAAKEPAPLPAPKPVPIVRPKPASTNTPTAKPASSRAFDHL